MSVPGQYEMWGAAPALVVTEQFLLDQLDAEFPMPTGLGKGEHQNILLRRRAFCSVAVFQAYGTGAVECICCGEADPTKLVHDHVFNDGWEDRAARRDLCSGDSKGSGSTLDRYLVRRRGQYGMRILGRVIHVQTACTVCNNGKGDDFVCKVHGNWMGPERHAL